MGEENDSGGRLLFSFFYFCISLLYNSFTGDKQVDEKKKISNKPISFAYGGREGGGRGEGLISTCDTPFLQFYEECQKK